MPLTAFTNAFAGNPLDRCGDRRGDAAWLAEQLASPAALGVALWNGRPLLEPHGSDGGRGQGQGGGLRIAYLPGGMVRELAGGQERLLFLGAWKGDPVFAVDLEGADDPAVGLLAGMVGGFEDLRRSAPALSVGELAILGTAKAMFEWRRKHRFCSVCGQPSHPAEGGWKRICESCRSEHFPRTDPVVIMLPVHGDRCLLGRQQAWVPGMFSALAGFLEPGESIEEACARELAEEAGLRTVSVRYHSAQPWPFPNSLMIGLIAEVEDDEGTPDQTELSEIRWLTRAEARDLLDGGLEGVHTPNPIAIAHQLIRAWAFEGS